MTVAVVSSCDLELCFITLTFDLELGRFKMNQYAKYLG